VSRTAYEPCSRCGGHGLVDQLYGPITCGECGGDCYVRARDNKGRYTTLEIDDRVEMDETR
jgi:DnaJ-class molecular chaperone